MHFLIKWILIALGALLVLLGLALFWLPLPLGLPLIVLGLGLLAAQSPQVRRWLHGFASRHKRLGWLERLLERFEPGAQDSSPGSATRAKRVAKDRSASDNSS